MVAACLLPLAITLAVSTAAAQSLQGDAAAERGVPGTPDPMAPHEGTTTIAAIDDKKRPPAMDLSLLYIGEVWRNAGGRTHGRKKRRIVDRCGWLTSHRVEAAGRTKAIGGMRMHANVYDRLGPGRRTEQN